MPAKAGVDYQSVNLHGLGFIPGQTSITVSVQVIGDNINEPNKDFFVNLIDAENATVVDAQGVGTIVDDDPLHLILDESGPASDQATALGARFYWCEIRFMFRVSPSGLTSERIEGRE